MDPVPAASDRGSAVLLQWGKFFKHRFCLCLNGVAVPDAFFHLPFPNAHGNRNFYGLLEAFGGRHSEKLCFQIISLGNVFYGEVRHPMIYPTFSCVWA